MFKDGKMGDGEGGRMVRVNARAQSDVCEQRKRDLLSAETIFTRTC